MAKILLEPCYILHKRDYRESSLLLQVFSQSHGRVDLLAKGAKRRSNRDCHLYSPWQELRMSWSIRTDLGTLTAIEGVSQGADTHGTEELYCGFYLNELLLRLLPLHVSFPELFLAYRDALRQLARKRSRDVVLRCFEKTLLGCLGYGLILDREAAGERRIEADKDYFYVPEHGPCVSRLNGEGMKISGRALLALSTGRLDPADSSMLAEIKALMRDLLNQHLQGRDLKSRELYRAWRASSAVSESRN